MKAGDMNRESVAKYASLWKTWRAWLIGKGLDWNSISADTVQEFLDGGSPSTGKSQRQPINPQKMSSYTRQRYWRLLRGVYASAVRGGLMDNNPALDLADAQRPTVARRDRQSQVLEPFFFARLCQPETLRAIVQLTSEDDWWHVRDRAIIAILVGTGITSAELLALRGIDVRQTAGQRPDSTLELPLNGAVGGPELEIDVMETSSNVGRTLKISPVLAPLVLAWVRRRENLLVTRSARSTSLQDRKRYLDEHDRQGPFLVARRAKSTNVVLPPLEQVTLYYTVSNVLKDLRTHMGLNSDGQETYVAKGPAVIRNSVIRQWLDTRGTEEAFALAGLKSADSLRLIANHTGDKA